MRRCPAAFYGDGSGVVGDDGLNDGQAEAGAVFLGGVVGGEEALTFFGRHAGAGVRDADFNFAVEWFCGEGERSAVGHGVHGVEDEIAECAMKQLGIGVEGHGLGRELDVEFDFCGCLNWLRRRCAVEGADALDCVFGVDALQLRAWAFC